MTWYKKPLKANARSGTQWSDDDYAKAGYGRLGLRLPQPVIDVLSERAESLGMSRAQFLEKVVNMQTDAEFRRSREEFERMREEQERFDEFKRLQAEFEEFRQQKEEFERFKRLEEKRVGRPPLKLTYARKK